MYRMLINNGSLVDIMYAYAYDAMGLKSKIFKLVQNHSWDFS